MLSDKCGEMLRWLDGNMNVDVGELEERKKEFENVCRPIINKLHGAGVQNNPGCGPSVEEVD